MHVQSLYDEHFKPEQIRRDQRNRIKEIVRTNSANPSIAIGLVRDYCKANSKIGFIRFDNPTNPENIIVFTEGSTYYYRFTNTKLQTPPTL